MSAIKEIERQGDGWASTVNRARSYSSSTTNTKGKSLKLSLLGSFEREVHSSVTAYVSALFALVVSYMHIYMYIGVCKEKLHVSCQVVSYTY